MIELTIWKLTLKRPGGIHHQSFAFPSQTINILYAIDISIKIYRFLSLSVSIHADYNPTHETVVIYAAISLLTTSTINIAVK